MKESYFQAERWSDVPASRAVNENQILSDFSCRRRGDVASNFPRRLVLLACASGLDRFLGVLETRQQLNMWHVLDVIVKPASSKCYFIRECLCDVGVWYFRFCTGNHIPELSQVEYLDILNTASNFDFHIY